MNRQIEATQNGPEMKSTQGLAMAEQNYIHSEAGSRRDAASWPEETFAAMRTSDNTAEYD